jgi:hypothetical protein
LRNSEIQLTKEENQKKNSVNARFLLFAGEIDCYVASKTYFRLVVERFLPFRREMMIFIIWRKNKIPNGNSRKK